MKSNWYLALTLIDDGLAENNIEKIESSVVIIEEIGSTADRLSEQL